MATNPNNTVIWLGAGFSYCATRGEIPLINGFFDGIDDNNEYPLIRGYLDQCGRCTSSMNIETMLGDIDSGACLPVDGDEAESIGLLPRRRELLEEVMRYVSERVTAREIDVDHWPIKFLGSAFGSTVITTNYDTIAEVVLANHVDATHCTSGATCPHCRMRSVLSYDCSCETLSPPDEQMWRGSILKLHGSITWSTCTNPCCSDDPCIQSTCDCSPASSPRCTCCGCPCSPVLIPPTNREKRYEQFPELKRMWKGAVNALVGATEIVVFGFSFTESDIPIRQLWTRCIERNTNLKSLAIIDVYPERILSKIEQFVEFKHPLSIHCLKSPADFSRPDWIHEIAATAGRA